MRFGQSRVPDQRAERRRRTRARAHRAATSTRRRRPKCAGSARHLGPLEETHRLSVPRPRPARARADAPIARARGRVGRRHRQRVARVPRRRGARLRRSPTCCSRDFPTHSEGYKSKVKAGIVSAASLARLAEDIDLGRFVLLGRGEEKTGGRQKHAILADGFEALIAAIYLDGGIDAAREFIAVARSGRSSRRPATGGRRDVHRRLEVGAPGMAAGRRPRPAALSARRRRGPGSSQAVRRRSGRRRRSARPRDRAIEEGSRAAGRATRPSLRLKG